jgi:hypothetical protein
MARRGRGKKRTSTKTTRAPTPKKIKPQETSNKTKIITTNGFESLQHVEMKGNTRLERKDPAPPPPIFVPTIINMQRLTAAIEQVVNRLNYTLKIINNDELKVMASKLE